MKKINYNEIENKNDNKIKKDNEIKITKRYSENINYEVEEKMNGIKLLKAETMNDYFENKVAENKEDNYDDICNNICMNSEIKEKDENDKLREQRET